MLRTTLSHKGRGENCGSAFYGEKYQEPDKFSTPLRRSAQSLTMFSSPLWERVPETFFFPSPLVGEGPEGWVRGHIT